MTPRVLAILSRLARNRSGTSLIETAFVIPAITLLISGVSDVAMSFASKFQLQQAANRSAALATVGGMSGPSFTTIQAEAAAAAGVTTDQVSVDTWLECAGVRQLAFNGVCTSGQQIGRFVSVTITANYVPKMPVMQYMGGSSWPLQGYSMVRLQ